MLLYAAVIAMWIQAAPAAKPAAKASVAGVVVNTNGEPIPNVRVSLGKLNVNLGAFTQLMTFDRPTVETTLPAELFRTIGDQLANEVAAGGIPPEEAAAAAAFKSIPVDDIHEIVASPNGSVAVIPKSMPPVMTDDRGRFAFPDVEPGTYRLMFAASGYAKQDYGQRTGAGGVPITLSPGQSKTDIVMRLLAVAAVSGHIRDARGEAVAGVPVQLFRFVYDASGQRQVQPVATTQSNDRGDYRMYYLSPGRYYVRAGNQPGEQPRRSGVESLLFGGGYSTANRIAQNYLLTYYPGVGDENSAAPLDVQPGADLRGVDFFLSLQQSYRVRGRVVDSRTGQPPPSATVTLYLQNPDPLSGGGFVGGNAGYRPADGTFEVQNVGAGRYNISATIPSPPQQRPPDLANMTPAERNAYVQSMQAAEFARPQAVTTVNVVNADVEGVLLTLGVSSSISGRLRVEANAAAGAPPIQLMRVQLRGGAVSPNSPVGGPQPRAISADGAFRIDNVWPAEYRVTLNGLPPGFYLKEARLGDEDVLNQPLRVAGQESRPLEMVISPNVGVIEGTAVDASGQPMPGAQVVLIPNRNRERTELFRPVIADLNGRYAITDIAPGEYALAAWEAMEPNAFFDRLLMEQADANGKAVRVMESAKQSVNITAIPVGR